MVDVLKRPSLQFFFFFFFLNLAPTFGGTKMLSDPSLRREKLED